MRVPLLYPKITFSSIEDSFGFLTTSASWYGLTNIDGGFATHFNESYKRGCQEKNSSSLLSAGEADVVLASSPISSWRSPWPRVLQTDRSPSIVSLDGFMTRGW